MHSGQAQDSFLIRDYRLFCPSFLLWSLKVLMHSTACPKAKEISAPMFAPYDANASGSGTYETRVLTVRLISAHFSPHVDNETLQQGDL